MGSFYVSHTLRGPSQAEVLALLRHRRAFVSRAENGFVTVLDERSDTQDLRVVREFGISLSAKFHCPLLAVVNHDDDLLYAELFEDGNKTDAYNSAPDVFDEFAEQEPTGGVAERMAAAFGVQDVGVVAGVLRRTDYVFAVHRHRDLANALSIPLHSVGIGYRYAREAAREGRIADNVYMHTAASE